MERMTLEELKQSDAPIITPEMASWFLGCNPHELRLQARQKPQTLSAGLGFPVCCIGSRVKIPRKPFLAFLGEKEEGI